MGWVCTKNNEKPRIFRTEIIMAYVLFISEQKLKDLSAIKLNCDPDLLRPYILQSQKLYIETALGTELNDKIKTLYECS